MPTIFDSHFHIIDPQFPLISNQSYLPPCFTIEDYLKIVEPLNFAGGVVVSGSFQGFDQTYLLNALKKLGSSFVGVTQLPFNVSDKEINHLYQKGIKAIRFNCKRDGKKTLEHLEDFAKRVYDVAGWHVELYIDSTDLSDLSKTLLKLPTVCIDHLGLSKDGFSTLLRLAEKGVKVKATGFGRVNFDVLPALIAIVKANPEALMFGSDLPSTRAPRPFISTDIDLILDNFDSNLADKILYENAIQFYKPTL